jgi:hypothetical protein
MHPYMQVARTILFTLTPSFLTLRMSFNGILRMEIVFDKPIGYRPKEFFLHVVNLHTLSIEKFIHVQLVQHKSLSHNSSIVTILCNQTHFGANYLYESQSCLNQEGMPPLQSSTPSLHYYKVFFFENICIQTHFSG